MDDEGVAVGLDDEGCDEGRDDEGRDDEGTGKNKLGKLDSSVLSECLNSSIQYLVLGKELALLMIR